MGLLLGTRDLGIEVTWRFGFVGHGSRAVSAPGVVYLDVGGMLDLGVLDHHQGGNAAGDLSATEVVLHHPHLVYNHLLGGLLRIHQDSGSVPREPRQFTLITHFAPDWDAVTACWLAMRLIEDGELPRIAHELAAFAKQVDQGLYGLSVTDPSALDSPHLGYLAIQHLPADVGYGARSDEDQLRLGLALMDRWVVDVMAAYAQSGIRLELQPGGLGSAGWRGDPRFAEAAALLDRDLAAFEADRASANVLQGVLLPAADGGEPIPAPAFIANGVTASVLNKYWVRAAGYPLFICPTPLSAKTTAGPLSPQEEFPRVILSMDPHFRVGDRRPSLRGLGRALEHAEAQQRRKLYGGVDDRGGEPRYADGYCHNADPWYDGRAHDFNIVDSPRVGTILPYRDVVRIATATHFWETKLEESAVVMAWGEHAEEDQMRGRGQPLPVFDGVSSTLARFYRESSETSDDVAVSSNHTAVRTTRRTRRFPMGMAAPLTIVELVSQPGATVEQLVRSCQAELANNGTEPDYTFARIRFAGYVADQDTVDQSLRQLAGSEMMRLDLGTPQSDLVLFNGRSLLLRERALDVDTASPDPDLEILLYAAFVNQTLIAFSRRLGEILPATGAMPDRLETGELRGQLLRFQASYYQLEVAHHPRGQRLYSELYQSLRIGEHYADVLAAAERLGELEEHLAEEREARAGRVMEIVLYFVAVFEVINAVMVFVMMAPAQRQSVLFLALTGIAVVIALVALGTIFYYRKPTRRRPARG